MPLVLHGGTGIPADMIKKALPSQTEAQLYLMIALPVMLSRRYRNTSIS